MGFYHGANLPLNPSPPPLSTPAGGIPDLGYRLYTPSHKSDYKEPPRGVELTYPRTRPRFGMLTKSTWNEASYAFGKPGALLAAAQGAARQKGFDMTHSGRDMTKGEISAQFTTTARLASEGGVAVSAKAVAAAAKTTAAVARSVYAPPAGGLPSVNPLDGGKKIVGVSGEIVRETTDARYDSMAQRAWTGVPDAGLAVGLGKDVRGERREARGERREERGERREERGAGRDSEPRSKEGSKANALQTLRKQLANASRKTNS